MTTTTTTATPSMKGKRWTKEEDEQLVFELLHGVLFVDIAACHGRTELAIKFRALMKAVAAIDEGLPIENASTQFCVSVEDIVKYQEKVVKTTAPTRKGKWTQGEKDALIDHIDHGLTPEQMAEIQGRSVAAIKSKLLSLAVEAVNYDTTYDDASKRYKCPVKTIQRHVEIVQKRQYAKTLKQEQKQTQGSPKTRAAKATIANVNVNAETKIELMIEIRDMLRILVEHFAEEK